MLLDLARRGSRQPSSCRVKTAFLRGASAGRSALVADMARLVILRSTVPVGAVCNELHAGAEPALVVEFLAPAGPFAGWIARLVDGGFGVALGGAGGTGAFRRHLACP